jgi:uncharacterized protein YcbK (DUF882 family)
MNINTIEVLGGVIVALLGLVTAIVEKGRRAAKTAADAASRSAASVEVVREQVQNSHTTNLREEADERHEENTSKLDSALDKLDGIAKNIRDLQDNDGRLFDLIVGNTKDIREIQKIRRDEREKRNDPHR